MKTALVGCATTPSADPTRTTGIRRSYRLDVQKRFRHIDVLQRKAITTQDVFGLREPERFTILQRLPSPREWAALTTAQQQAAYMQWIEESRASSFEFTIGPRGGILTTGPTPRYIRDPVLRTYGRAIVQADALARRAGIPAATPGPLALPDFRSVDFVLREPRHADALQAIFGRNLRELDGVGRAYEQRIQRALADGLANNWTPDRIARTIREGTKGITGARAKTMANTEIVRAHAEGTLNRFDQLGVETVGVVVEMEFTTAGDNRVCASCEALEGELFTITEARGVIPVHANCRCRWTPQI